MAMWHRRSTRTPVGDASLGEKLARAKGKAQYAKRKWMSEGPNGWVKEVLGFRRFSLRGLEVRGEWHLVCLALNIRRRRRWPRDAGSPGPRCCGLGKARRVPIAFEGSDCPRPPPGQGTAQAPSQTR